MNTHPNLTSADIRLLTTSEVDTSIITSQGEICRILGRELLHGGRHTKVAVRFRRERFGEYLMCAEVDQFPIIKKETSLQQSLDVATFPFKKELKCQAQNLP